MVKNLISTVIFGSALAIFFMYTIPGMKEVQVQVQKKNQLVAQKDQFEELEKTRADLSVKFNSIGQEELDRINNALPTEVSAIKLVTQIDRISKEMGLLLKSINVEETSSKKAQLSADGMDLGYNSASVMFNVSGSYEVFLSFLASLESSLQIIDVKDLSFAVGGKPNSYEFNVRASTYYAGNE